MWSIKEWRLFEGGIYFRHCLPGCGVYLRVAFNRGNTVHTIQRKSDPVANFVTRLEQTYQQAYWRDKSPAKYTICCCMGSYRRDWFMSVWRLMLYLVFKGTKSYA